jgi:hypothetical protein
MSMGGESKAVGGAILSIDKVYRYQLWRDLVAPASAPVLPGTEPDRPRSGCSS